MHEAGRRFGVHQEPKIGEPLAPTIDQERQVLQREAAFFTGFEPKGYVGVLVNTRVDSVTSLYPQVIYGMVILYDHIQKESLDLSSEEGFMIRFLEKQYLDGRLISNTEVEDFRQRLQTGDYSLQYDAYLRYRDRMSGNSRNPEEQKKDGSFGPFKRPIFNENDALYDKRMVLARVVGMEAQLRATYGEVDYGKALLTELVLNAPFLVTAITSDSIDAEARERHRAYLEEITAFTQSFDPTRRFEVFGQLTEQYPTQWVEETYIPHLSDFDKGFIERIYGFTDSLNQGSFDIEGLHALLRQTILRRGQLFVATEISTPGGHSYLSLDPRESSGISFEDIAGYERQKGFYKTLLERTESEDPIVSDIRIVIAAGEPGLGKSLGVQAFLNSLPENAKGLFMKVSGRTNEYDLLVSLAKMHPEVHIFVVIEDIDGLLGDRMTNYTTHKFLEIDSAISDTVPTNFHILATTNRPEVIDSAVIRPGRTAKILVYDHPDDEDRRQIITLHAQKNDFNLPNEIIDIIVEKTEGLSPDEVRHITTWPVRFEGINEPTAEDIERLADEIRAQHALEKESRVKHKEV